MAADKEGNLAVVAAEAEEGKYLADIVLVRKNAHKASIHEIDADAELLDEAESYAIATPRPPHSSESPWPKATPPTPRATHTPSTRHSTPSPRVTPRHGSSQATCSPTKRQAVVIYLTASQAIDRVALPVITPPRLRSSTRPPSASPVPQRVQP